MNKSVGNLSLIEKIGQMFIVGIDGSTPDDTIMELIQTYKIGGILLCDKNIESVEQTLKLINEIKSINMGNEVPLFITTSHEGGRAGVIPNEIRKIPAIKYIAENSDKNLIFDTAKMTGKILKCLGINLNFWPVLDLGGTVEGKLLGDRCISVNSTIVTSYGMQIVNGLNDSGIIAVPKYFPGHGTTKTTTNKIIIPSTKKSIAKLEQSDLAPFRSAIENGVDAMLVGHINLSKVNLFAPATMSHKIITKLLKEKYDYKGLVISDDLCNISVDIQYGIKSSARKAILAGNDIMIVKDTSKVKSVLEDIEKQIKRGNIDEQEINLRVQKILDIKTKFNLKDTEITEIEIEKINNEIEQLLVKIRE